MPSITHGVGSFRSRPANQLDAAARQLTAIAARMTSDPEFLALVTAGGPTYTRPDGVHVVSVTKLGP
ncbi:MAG: hypothetical protein LBG11_02895 [Bifidobacteriaceae bacterium]|nr:hypothetical protein [Bifidobacteriaceae bacterium]